MTGEMPAEVVDGQGTARFRRKRDAVGGWREGKPINANSHNA
jgi:hypothetical protein